MAFEKKQAVRVDGRPKTSKIELREAKVAALKSENTPEARKTLKRMNDVVYRGNRSNLKEWFAPKGKKQTARP